MNPERWERVQELVGGALDLPEDDRTAFVERGCKGDAELKKEVLSLLTVEAVDSPPSRWLTALAAPEEDRFAPGDRVADRYRVERLLGRGGMGEVYEAFDEDLGITVALKTLREVESAAAERLKLEGMLARSVWHPNVCRVYEVGRHEDSLWFLTMERLEGRTLADRLHDDGPPSRAEALRIVEDIAGGLGAAHKAGVVHRDLKPANVMLVVRDGAEQAVVTDFGISRAPGAKDGVVVFGTPEYMAPEQRRGEEVGPHADIYALGRVMRALLPGEDAVIARCEEEDPRKRFARAEDVVDALHGRAPAAVEQVSAWPAERDRFVGREADLEAIERALADARLVTLVGPGGMGKTRLAIRFGAGKSFPGGCWFCDLTEAKSVDGIASAVGGALSVPLGRGDAIQQLGHAIAVRGRCLLVLDNFEQIVRHAAETVGRWRQLAPEATFLVTSRVRLPLENERAIAIEPLSLEEGTELFSLRAHGLRPGLEFTDDAARDIVRHLDGIPLAIELAAARTRVMSVAQVAENLRKRFQLLAGGSGARHETLEGTIAESWEMLAPWEKAAWAQCAVFEGGGTLEAATAVVDLGAWPGAPATVDVLQSLVDQSLLRTYVPPSGGAFDVRFGMYVALQEYARGRLHASPDEERAADGRHGAHYAGYGREEEILALDRQHGPARRRRLTRELDNLLGACRRAIVRGDGAIVASTYRAAEAVLRNQGPLETAVAIGREALADSRLTGVDRARVGLALCDVEMLGALYEDTLVHCQAALALARELGEGPLAARIAAVQGRVHHVLGRHAEAEQVLSAGLERADQASAAVVLNTLGILQIEQGRPEEARASYEGSLAIARDLGDRTQQGITLTSLGILHHRSGRLAAAREHFEAAIAIAQETGNRRSEGLGHMNLASLLTDQGCLAEALEHAEASFAIARGTGVRTLQGTALTVLGEICTQMGNLDEAEERYEAALAVHEELGDRRTQGFNYANLARVYGLRGQLERARAGYERAIVFHRETKSRYYEIGDLAALGEVLLRLGEYAKANEALTTAEPVLRELGASHQLAALLCTRAELAHATGDAEGARAALAEAEVLVAESGVRPESELGELLARARAVLSAPAKA